MGISKLLKVATSYWPAWLENSWLILSRTSFSGRTVKFTEMPVSAVKFSLVNCWRSTIWGLFTISTLMVSGPPPVGPPPQPAHPLTPTASVLAVAAASTRRRRLRRASVMASPGGYVAGYAHMSTACLICCGLSLTTEWHPVKGSENEPPHAREQESEWQSRTADPRKSS